MVCVTHKIKTIKQKYFMAEYSLGCSHTTEKITVTATVITVASTFCQSHYGSDDVNYRNCGNGCHGDGILDRIAKV